MKLTRRSVYLGLTASLVTPVFSRVARAASETIKIGMALPVTGRPPILANTRSLTRRSRWTASREDTVDNGAPLLDDQEAN